jgi:predicted O-methyltransferase YrrM
MEAAEWVEPMLEDYLSRYNRRRDTAIAIEGALALVRACAEKMPRRILDLGSGFSSVIFREWARRQSARIEVVSTDDNPGWLAVTQLELAERGFDPRSCIAQASFEVWPERGRFDLLFVDWSGVESRAERLDDILEWATSGALVVFDDYHFDVFAAKLREACEERALELAVDVASLDGFGRVQARVKVP